MITKAIEKIFFSMIVVLLLLAGICWGSIALNEYHGHDSLLVERELPADMDHTVKRIRGNAAAFSGAVVILWRFVSLASEEE